ncbi:ATP-binding protein [Nisaea sp.]|uniref:ATP-binding protein n=1 Tax=Nisaea sp. TaxID=2024842 RepID=UPI003297D890
MQGILGQSGELDEGGLYDRARPYMNQLQDIRNSIEGMFSSLDKNSPEAELFEKLSRDFDTLRQHYVSAVVMTTVDLDHYAEQMHRTNEQYQQIYSRLRAITNLRLSAKASATKASTAFDERLQQILAVDFALSLLISLIASWLVYKVMSRDLFGAIEALERLAKGEPAAISLDQTRTDELGKLARTISFFEGILDKLRLEVIEREQSEAKYRDLFNNAGDAIMLLEDRKYVALNKRAEEMFLVEPADVIGKPLGRLSGNLHDTAEETTTALNKVFDAARNGERQIVEWRGRKSDGTQFPTELTVTSLTGPNGQEIAQFVIRDISNRVERDQSKENMTAELERMVSARTEELQREVAVRKETQDALAAEQKTLEAVVDLAPIGMILLDMENQVRLINNWIRSSHNLPAELCEPGTDYKKTLRFLIDNKRSTRLSDDAVDAIFDKRIAILEKRVDDVLEDELPDGSIHKVERRFIDDVGCIITSTDITDLKNAQSELVHREKMAALGGLVAGVAHEVNTPLGICVTASSHVSQLVKGFEADLTGSGKALTRARAVGSLTTIVDGMMIIERNLGRAAELIRNFKLVAVDQTADDARTIDLGDYITSTVQSLSAETRRLDLTIDLKLPDVAIKRRTYPGAIAQIVTNLVINAGIHAYQDAGGSIEIELEPRDEDSAIVRFQDFGGGMDEATVEKIFDPFFTTRRDHGGTGLGMHIVYNLVTQRLGGKIRCNSQPGKGTSFEITF